MDFSINERVFVIEPRKRGEGILHRGKVADIFDVDLHTTAVEIAFDEPDASGNMGITIVNPTERRIKKTIET